MTSIKTYFVQNLEYYIIDTCFQKMGRTITLSFRIRLLTYSGKNVLEIKTKVFSKLFFKEKKVSKDCLS